MPVSVVYQAKAHAVGGRDGRAYTDDAALEIFLSTPKELGGSGGNGANPEQLFAMGYAACFIGALRYVASQSAVKVPDDTKVTSIVGIGRRSEGGFGLTVTLEITLPGISKKDSKQLIEDAHQVCPYSNATRNNVDVVLREVV